MNSAQKLAATRDGAKIKALYPYLEAEVGSLITRVEARAEELYARNELSGDVAMQLWAERLAYRRLLRAIDQRVRFGESAGVDIAPEMELLAQ